MLAAVRSAVLDGVDGRIVTVEVHVANGLPGYTVVGLPDAAGRESRERVRAALLSSDLEYPMRRVTVNLAPAAVRKTGSGLELAVALGLIGASGALPTETVGRLGVLGELGLDGRVRPVPGTLALVHALVTAGATTVVVPEVNAAEAALVPGADVRVARTLRELCACLTDSAPWPELPVPDPAESDPSGDPPGDEPVDLADVRGLAPARLALAAAAAGAHHALFVGPPGVGKTMLARRLPTIMAPLDHDEALEVAKIHSAAATGRGGRLVRTPPFRAPHHGASAVALVGGGAARPRPGEISLAHRGALFLDELPEFTGPALEALRQPLEERVVRVSRAGGATTFPADFLLVACANPCPCGRALDDCRCGDVQRARYARRLSAPLLDRFDLRLHIARAGDATPESSADVAARVAAAVARQRARLTGTPWRRNAHVPAGALCHGAALNPEAHTAWRAIIDDRSLTGRGAARVRRVARTLADLDDRSEITPDDIERACWLREDLW